MEYQQPRGYMWQQTQPQPPPPGSDPYQVPPPPTPHMPPQTAGHPWPYPATQFQFQSPAAPPPPPQWPPPHQHLPPYPGQQPVSLTSQYMPYPQHPHYPQPHQFPPRPPQGPHSSVQDSGTATWSHPQYATNSNEEDWGAKARAWAAAKTADGQVPPPHLPPYGGNQDANNLQKQYPQPQDPQHSEMHKPIGPPSNYQQYPFPTGPPTEISQRHLQVSQHGYATESTVPFSSMDRNQSSDSALSPMDQKSSKIQIVHPQEVPSSYSSLAGTGVAGDGIEQIDGFSSMPISSHTHPHVQYQQFANGRPGWVENPQVLGGRADSVAELSNQPLNFSPHFNHNRDMIVADPGLRIAANFAWSPAPGPGPGPVYAPVPPPIPSISHQADPMTVPPPSGPSAPIFPAGPGFQPTVPMIGATFGAASVVLPHPTSFPGDAYGVSERPKKAPVPNWLREEIIKKKASLGSSAPNIDKVDSPSIEGDGEDVYYRNRDQADSKSIDSSRSVEEEEDDDEVAPEAARTAAVNKEIKRILTEVLLKVTEELFDEIASKVLREDDVSSEAREDADQPEHQNVASTPSVSTSRASVKVLFPAKYKGAVNEEDVHDKSNSSSVGDVLGLASYASDEEEEDDDGKSELDPPELFSSKFLNSNVAMENCSISGVKIEGMNFTGLDGGGTGQQTPVSADKDQGSSIAKSKGTLGVYHSAAGDDPSYSGRPSDDGIDESKFSKSYQKDAERNDGLRNDSQLKSTLEGSADKSRDIKNLNKKERKDVENRKEMICDKGDEEHARRDKKTERVSYNDVSRGKTTEKVRADEKMMKSRSRRAESPYSEQEDRNGMRSKKRSSRDDKGEKWSDRSIDEKNERGKHRGRESKDHSRMSYVNDSSDESSGSGYSRRKSHRSRRDRSPSPVRSSKRHSKRRHSPYSMETTRRKRSPSRSNSPVRRNH